ncbi:hypothetical protein BJ917_4089 [Pseudomonas sp. WPR_5_2]|nr:hypothetical protein BJ917_4089 [Pseudomonas sp. WPR_5_2]
MLLYFLGGFSQVSIRGVAGCYSFAIGFVVPRAIEKNADSQRDTFYLDFFFLFLQFIRRLIFFRRSRSRSRSRRDGYQHARRCPLQ